STHSLSLTITALPFSPWGGSITAPRKSIPVSRSATVSCRNRAVLSFRSEAREASGSETAGGELAAYRRHGFRPDVERQLTDGRRPMQFILIVVTIAAAILFDVRPSGAYQGPWCAVENIGQDVRYDCSMRTLEQCVSLIIAGNRGFCNPNPYYRGPEAASPRVKRKR